jgi:glycosyltransferase involved in cell wall biosynthesis
MGLLFLFVFFVISTIHSSSTSFTSPPVPIAVLVNIFSLADTTNIETNLESILRSFAFDNFEPHLLLLSREINSTKSPLAKELTQLCGTKIKGIGLGSCQIMVQDDPNHTPLAPSQNGMTKSESESHPLLASWKDLIHHHQHLLRQVKAILYLDSFIQLARGSVSQMYLGIQHSSGNGITIPRCLTQSKDSSCCSRFQSLWNMQDLPLGVSVDSLGKKMYQLSQTIDPISLSSPCSTLGMESRVLMISSQHLNKFLQGFHVSSPSSPLSSSSPRYHPFELPSGMTCHQIHSSLVVDILPAHLSIPTLRISSHDNLYLHSSSSQQLLQQPQIFDQLISKYLQEFHQHYPISSSLNISLLYLLNDVSISGGVISILQEVISMRARGIRAHVAVQATSSLKLLSTFIHGLSPSNLKILDGMIITFTGRCCYPHKPPSSLLELASTFDIVIGTYFTTISAVSAISAKYPHILPAYYVQDYEPWFLCSPKDCLVDTRSPLRRRQLHSFSLSTYTSLNHKIFMFAKSNWIIEMVKQNHGNESNIHKVTASIDHLTYYPPLSSARRLRDQQNHVQVIAMIRPTTPRRNAMVCLDLMLKLAYEFKGSNPKVSVVLFGAPKASMIKLFQTLIETHGPAPHRTKAVLFGTNIQLLKVLNTRSSLAYLYRQSDIFVDISWWQAFGRSGVEAMACGTVPIFPLIGASTEVCEGGKSCVYHDGDDTKGFYETLSSLVRNHTHRRLLSREGLRRSEDYSVESASASIISTLTSGLDQWRSSKVRHT